MLVKVTFVINHARCQYDYLTLILRIVQFDRLQHFVCLLKYEALLRNLIFFFVQNA
jgi:hypothetical protein